MKDVLDQVLDNKTKTRILRILCKRNSGWTGRQLAKELNISPTTASKVLGELTRDGIIIMAGVGRAYLYRLNDKNYAVKNILAPFFQKEEDIFDILVTLIKKNLSKSAVDIESAVIFGSVAANTQTSRSDIDLLVVVNDLKDKKKIEDKLFEISGAIAGNFQTVVSPYVLTASQFRKKYKEKSAIINEILKSYILIMGKSPQRLII